MTTITKSIVFKWKLKGNEKYQWASDGRLYNIQTMRTIKKTVNGYSIGYWIAGKFITLDKLREQLIKIERIKAPF